MLAAKALDRVADASIDGELIAWDDAIGSARQAERGPLTQFRALLEGRSESPNSFIAMRPDRGWGLAAILVTLICGIKLMLAIMAFGWAFAVATTPPEASASLLLVMVSCATAAAWLSVASTDVKGRALGAIYATSAVSFANPLIDGAASAVPSAAITALRSAGLYPEAFLAAAFITFALRFPAVHRFTRFDRIGRRAVEPAVWTLGLFLFMVNLAFGLGLMPGWLAALRPLQRTHPSQTFWFILSMPSALAVAVVALRTHRADSDERRRVMRFGWAMLVTAAPFFLYALALLFPPFRAWYRAAAVADQQLLITAIRASLALLPLATAFTVISDRALSVAVARTTQRILTGRAVILLALLPIAWLVIRVYRMRSAPVAAAFDGAGGRVLGLLTLAGLAIIAFRPQIQRLVDRSFGYSPTDRTAKFRAALEQARNARGSRELIFRASTELRDTLDASFVTVLQRDGGQLSAMFGTSPLVVTLDSALGAMLAATDQHLDMSAEGQILALLPRSDRERISSCAVHGFTPVRTRDGQLVAAIATGRRHNQTITAEDRWLLESLAQLIAIGWGQQDAQQAGNGTASAPDALGELEVAFECPRCGHVAAGRTLPCDCGRAAEPAALPGTLNGKFRLIRRIGRGGMGVVYLAKDLVLGREVAIKTLPSASASAIERLQSEAHTMAAFNHPGLATLYGLEIWQRTPALVVEYFSDGTLSRRLAAGPMSPADILSICIDLCETLAYLHERGCAHCDVKPSNIGLSPTNRPKLLDFGLARLVTATQDAETGRHQLDIAGTPAYMPPEALEGMGTESQRDLWAVSMMVLEGATGRHPFADAAGRPSSRTTSSSCRQAIDRGIHSPALAAALTRALHVDVSERFPDAPALRAALIAARAST